MGTFANWWAQPVHPGLNLQPGCFVLSISIRTFVQLIILVLLNLIIVVALQVQLMIVV